MTIFMEGKLMVATRSRTARSSLPLGAPIQSNGSLQIWSAHGSEVLTVATSGHRAGERTGEHPDETAEDAWLGQLAIEALAEMSTKGVQAVPLAELWAELDTDPEG